MEASSCHRDEGLSHSTGVGATAETRENPGEAPALRSEDLGTPQSGSILIPLLLSPSLSFPLLANDFSFINKQLIVLCPTAVFPFSAV